jgi:3',5'-cyclic AMP phosphodiesterase CpdA
MKRVIGGCVLLLIGVAGCSREPGEPVTEAGPADVTADIAADAPAGDVVDGGVAPEDAGDPHGGLRLPRCEETEPAGAGEPAAVASTLLGSLLPMATRVMTPDTRSMMNPVFETGERAYRALGYDRYARGPAVARERRMDLGGPATAPASGRRSLAWFVALSDTQLADDESPTRYGALDSPQLSGAIRPQEAYLPHAMTAMNRTLRDVTRGGRAFQFGVVAGDCADSAQENELGWFMQLMDGAAGVHVDSAADDDPVPGPGNDPKDAFDAVAFPAPWYFVPGNHDVMVVGTTAPTPAQRASAVGAVSSFGTRDYTEWYAPPRRGAVPPDPARRLLDRADIVRALRAGPATPGPLGHGYPATPDVATGAHWTGDVVPGLLRVIALDTSDLTGGSPGMVRRAVFDGWLRAELERAQSDGVLVLLASHHAPTSIDRREGEFGAEQPDAVSAAEVEARVASYPNVIAWLVGHEHDVRVRAVRGADAAHPGYWEVQSGSLADWPNQLRAVEVVDNGDGTLSLFGTMLDFAAESCMERRFRRLSVMDYVSGWEASHVGTALDRNVELVIPVPAAARARIEAAAITAPTRIESETTLRGMR